MNPKIDSPIKLYFYKFLKGGKKQIQVGDIILSPEYDEYSDKIYWTMDNPNDSSYSSYVLMGYVQESAYDFGKLTSNDYFKEVDRKQKLETPQAIYIKPNDEEKFLELAQETTNFKYKEIKMNIHAFDITTRVDSDGVYFTISVICLNPYNTKKEQNLTYSELKERLNEYKEWDSYFDYTEYFFSNLLDYVWNEAPSIFDQTNMITQADIRYFTPTHKEIKLW